MEPEDRQKIGLILILVFPILFWLEVVRRTRGLESSKMAFPLCLAQTNPSKTSPHYGRYRRLNLCLCAHFHIKKIEVSEIFQGLLTGLSKIPNYFQVRLGKENTRTANQGGRCPDAP